MSDIRTLRTGVLACIAVAVCFGAPAGLAAASQTPAGADASWDAQRYIKVDEVKPGMTGYCLTDYGEHGIEKFALKVVNVVHNIEPGRNAILVMGTDERFRHSGIVAGCSGSPVYFDGRLAGALAFGWEFGKDPLYGVTPIDEMLQVGCGCDATTPQNPARSAAVSFDFSQPINLAEVGAQLAARKLPGTTSAGRRRCLVRCSCPACRPKPVSNSPGNWRPWASRRRRA
jgi:hypothetical protein